MKFIFRVSTQRVLSTVKEEVEVPDDEIEEMTEDEIDDYVYEEYYKPWLESTLDMGFSRSGDEE